MPVTNPFCPMEINKCLRFPNLFIYLSEEPQWLKLLLDGGKPYDTFLQEMIMHGERTYEENKALPKGYNTAKRISERLGLKPGLVNKWIYKIAEDLISLNDARPNLFYTEGEIPCSIRGCYFGEWFHWFLSLPVLPRTGDSFDFRLANLFVGYSSFTVNGVTFFREAGMTCIQINLKQGYGGLYKTLQRQRARLLGLTDYSIKSYLNEEEILLELAAGERYIK